MRRLVLLLALAALAAIVPATAGAKDRGDGWWHRHHAVSGLDKRFLKELSAGNWFEVHAGQLAVQKGSSQAVKDLGAKLAADHAANQQTVERLAARYRIAVPAKPTATQEIILRTLATLDAAHFDSAWLVVQLAHHEDTKLLLKDEIEDGKNRRIRKHAKMTLPVVEMHHHAVAGLLGLPMS